MVRRFQNRALYLLERLFSRGPWAQLLVVAVLIAAISLLGGVSAFLLEPDRFSLGSAIWWAFLRLTDPGYLGDDEGVAIRTLSTILTVAGYVVFLGALVAILTGWLQRTMRRLESGITPYAGREHFVLLGVTNRTPVIIEQLLGSRNRVRRFLRRHGASRLRIAVLADDAARAITDLRSRLGPVWSSRKVIVRSGSPLRSDHLARVDPTNASAIILPSNEFEGRAADLADTVTIKTLLSLDIAAREDPESPPLVVAELRDARNATIARAAYKGPLELIASDRMMGRILAQSIRHHGMSAVYAELLAHNDGNEIFVRDASSSERGPLSTIAARIPDGIVLGVIGSGAEGAGVDRDGSDRIRPRLNPPSDLTVEPGDRLVVLARSLEETMPRSRVAIEPVHRSSGHGGDRPATRTRLLVLGWNRRVATLVNELSDYPSEAFEITIASRVSADHRRRVLETVVSPSDRTTCGLIESDYGNPAELEALDPLGYDVVLMVASEWLETGEHADARTISAALLIRELAGERRPSVILELSRSDNADLIPSGTGEIIITPQIMSYVLTQIALRFDLSVVIEELFAAGGTEISLVRRDAYELPAAAITFSRLEQAAALSGHTALGYRDATGATIINPGRSARVPSDAPAIVSVVSNSWSTNS